MTDTITTTEPLAGHERYSWESDEDNDARVAASIDRRARQLEALAVAMELVRAANTTVPSISWDTDGVALAWHAYDEAAFDALRRALGSSLDSPWAKGTTSWGSLYVERTLAPGVTAKVYAGWGTCEQVEVGTKVVDREVEVCPDCGRDLDTLDTGHVVCSDGDCSYERRPAAKVTRQVEEPELEWRCPDVSDL